MGLICTTGIHSEKTILPEDPSSGALYLTLCELEMIRDSDMSPTLRTRQLCSRILALLDEIPLNPLKIRDISRIIASWESWQKKLLFTGGVVHHLFDVIKPYIKMKDFMTDELIVESPEKSPELKQSSLTKATKDQVGVGYSTGSTACHWNLKKAIEKRRSKDAIIISIIRVLRSCIAHLEVDTTTPDQPDLPIFEMINCEKSHISQDLKFCLSQNEMLTFFQRSLSNESILDVSEHIELYTAIMRLLTTISIFPQVGVIMIRPHPGIDKTLIQYVIIFRQNLLAYCRTLNHLTYQGDQFSLFMKRMESWFTTITTGLSYLYSYNLTEDLQQIESTSQSMAGLEDQKTKYALVLKAGQIGVTNFADEEGRRLVAYSFEKEANAIQPFSVGLASRMSRIAKEIASLRNSLPLSYESSIFVCMDESRSDVLKALITGPRDTPYEDGCFELDVFFPKNYPNAPPKIKLTTTGNGTVRFNPNLYNDGKVCLSILNTWEGRPEERWNPSFSVLQVLVSIQALIFVPEPYFNEPGFEQARGTSQAQVESQAYNTRLRLATIQFAISSQAAKPSICFEEIIRAHFILKRNEIIERVDGWFKKLKIKEQPLSMLEDYEDDEISVDAMPLTKTDILARIAEMKNVLTELRPPTTLTLDITSG